MVKEIEKQKKEEEKIKKKLAEEEYNNKHSRFVEYAKQRAYPPTLDPRYDDRYKGYATYYATIDLNQKMDRVTELLTRLVELEETRAVKEGYFPE